MPHLKSMRKGESMMRYVQYDDNDIFHDDDDHHDYDDDDE